MVRRICSTASCRGRGSYRDRSVISSFIAGLIEALEACRLRLRPIVMTSVAFIAGTIPLVLSGGAGAEVRSATGVTVFDITITRQRRQNMQSKRQLASF